MFASRIMRTLFACSLAFALFPASAWASTQESISPSALPGVKAVSGYDASSASGSDSSGGSADVSGNQVSDDQALNNRIPGSEAESAHPGDNGAPSGSTGSAGSAGSNGSSHPTNLTDDVSLPDSNGSSNIAGSAGSTEVGSSINSSDATDTTGTLDAAATKQDICAANVRIAGVTDHLPGEEFSQENWIPLSEFTWKKGEPKTAWEAFASFLDTAGYTYDLNGGCPNSITTPDGSQTLAMTWTSPYSYWVFYVNGEYASVVASSYELQDGDTVELVYLDSTGVETPPAVSIDGTASRPDWEADWSGASGSGSALGSTGTINVSSPTTSDSAKLEFAFDYSKYSDTFASASEPIIVNNRIFIAVNSKLLMLDAENGTLLKEAALAASISMTSRPVYADGLLIVPLTSGRVQALTADALITVWLTDKISDLTQSSCSISVSDGSIYVATVDIATDANWNSTYSHGTVTCINLHNGAIRWRRVNPDEGYYWSSAAISGEYLFIPTSAGTVELLDRASGTLLDSVKVGSIINADCIVDDAGIAYVVSKDGVVHRFMADTNASAGAGVGAGADAGAGAGVGAPAVKLRELAPLATGLVSSTCTPAKAHGKLIVGGMADAKHAALSIVDLASGTIQLITKADGKEICSDLGGIKGAPLVVTQGSETFVYFTNNGAEGTWPDFTSGGGIYCYRLGDAEAHMIFDATGYHGFCDSPIVCDAQGNLYYINDSSHLFKIGKVTHNDSNTDGSGGFDDGFGGIGSGSILQRPDANTGAYRPSSHVPWMRPIASAPLGALGYEADAGMASLQPNLTDEEVDAEDNPLSGGLNGLNGEAGYTISSERFQQAINTTISIIMVIGVIGLILSALYLYRTRNERRQLW